MAREFSKKPYFPHIIGAFSSVFVLLSLVFMVGAQGIHMGSRPFVLISVLVFSALAGIAVAFLLQKNQALEASNESLKDFANRLSDENQSLNGALLDAFDGSYLRDENGMFKEVDETFAKTLGFDNADTALKALKALGGNFYKSTTGLSDYLFELQKNGSIIGFESEVRGSSGKSKWIVETVKTIKKDGNVFFKGSVRDVSKYHKENKETESQGQVQTFHSHKAEALGVLAEGIADEMHIPAKDAKDNIIFLKEVFSGFVKIVNSAKKLIEAVSKDPNPPAEVKEALAAMKEYKLDYILQETPKALEKAESEINDVCSLAKSVKSFSQTEPVDKNMVDINETIKNAVAVSRNRWQSFVDLKTDFGNGIPLVPCVASEFTQVMLNLIMNAAEAIKENHNDGLGSIVIRTSHDDEWAVVKLIDNGGGIPNDVLKNIFVPFFTTKKKGSGFGQGLAYCQGIISQKHGGILDVTSKVGKGSTFTIKLPLTPEESKGDTNVERIAG